MSLQKFLSFGFLLLLTACGGKESGPTDYGDRPLPVGTVSTELVSYVEAFESRYNVDINFTVAFDDEGETGGDNESGGTTVGVCRVWSNGVREVLVNRKWWNHADRETGYGRMLLIFHELGHCYYDRDHDTRMYPASSVPRVGSYEMPYTLMYPTLNPTQAHFQSSENKANYFLEELSDISKAGNYLIQYNFSSEYLTVREFHLMEDQNCEEVMREYPH